VQESLNEAACMSLIPLRSEKRSEAVKEAIEFGLQCQELLLIHERPPRDVLGSSRMIDLVPDPVLA
jgi:hypothetical protein